MKEIFVLSNFNDLSDQINTPLKQTQRIKYTCFDASDKFLVCGASSGSLYLFQREPFSFLQLIPNKYGSINQVSISPQEKMISFATVKGTICVYSIDLSAQPQATTSQIEGPLVTCFYWTSDEKHLYFGDRKGNVSMINISFFMGRSVLPSKAHLILLLDSSIAQISGFDKFLLASTQTKCVLCQTEREEFKQIGNRPRDGDYGACFLPTKIPTNILSTRIYCARPGSRFWEVDLDGQVLQTHQFKQALATKPTNIIKNNEKTENILTDDIEENNYQQQSLQFSKIIKIYENLLFCYTENGFYIFDPVNSSIVLWNNEFGDIHSIRIVNNFIVNIFTTHSEMYSLELLSLYDYSISLFNFENYLECYFVIKANLEYFQERIRVQRGLGLLFKLKEFLDDELIDGLKEFFDELKEDNCVRYENGIYVLENQFDITNNSKNSMKSIVLQKYGSMLSFDDLGQYDDDEIVERESIGKIVMPKEHTITEEDKIVRNLFMIYKSSKISNTNFLERYSCIFDSYDSKEVINLLSKLEIELQENGESNLDAKKNCVMLYFDYLKPEIIYEVDSESRGFITEGFILVNTPANDDSEAKCEDCDFTLKILKNCLYPEIGAVLLNYFWSRKEYEKCFEISRKVSFMFHQICKFYIQERNYEKIVPYVLTIRDVNLFNKAVDSWNPKIWEESFKCMTKLKENRSFCLNCNKIQNSKENLRFSWNYFLNSIVDNLDGSFALGLVLKYSEEIPNFEVEKDFFLKCLLLP